MAKVTAAIVIGATVLAFYGSVLAPHGSVLAPHGRALAQAGGASAPSDTGRTSADAARTPAEVDVDICNREAGLRSVASASPRAERPAGAPVSSPRNTAIGSGASVGAGAAAGASSGGGSTLDAGGAFTSSPRILTEPEPPGMASAGFTDPVYQRAYRDCLRRRGF